MEQEKEPSYKHCNKSFLGKKTQNLKKCSKSEDSPKLEELNTNSNSNSFLYETSAEISNDNLINVDEKYENIPGLDDIKIPSFLNDIIENDNINRKIKKYYKIKKELGSDELAKIYLIDVNKFYGHKKKF